MNPTELRLDALLTPLSFADAKDWDRLEAHLATDNSGHGRIWQQAIRELRAAVERELKTSS